MVVDSWLLCEFASYVVLGFPWLVAVWWLLSGFADDGVGFLVVWVF